MVNPFICGSFHHQDGDDMEILSPCSTPKRSKKSSLRIRSSNKNNPYSDRGLDKFSALLADLEDKKQKIYSQIAPDDISLVRFVYSNSNDAKPIIVKLKDKKSSAMNLESPKKQRTPEVYEDCQEGKVEPEEKRVIKRSGSNWSTWQNLRRPKFYFPMTIVLILIFLAIYGRSFAIMCTSIGWYLVPIIRKGNSRSSTSTSTRQPKRKKDYMRRFSEKSVVREEPNSPTSVMNGPSGKHDHRKSWS